MDPCILVNYIARAPTPRGVRCNLIPMKWWDKYLCKEIELTPNWDGSRHDDAIERLHSVSTILVSKEDKHADLAVDCHEAVLIQRPC